MEQKNVNEERFPVANLDPTILSQIQDLEKDLQHGTNKDVILIAYEDKK